MKTAQKIQIARAAYRAVHLGRTIIGQSDRCVVTRNGMTYDLDLSQGIDFAIYLGDIFERSTRAALRRLVRPPALVLDIGANIGAHTLHLAKFVGPHGRVLAFEPTDFAFRKQARNLALNPELAQRVIAYQCFLAAEDGAPVPGSIYSSWPLLEAANGHAKHLGHEMPTKSARARSLDSVLSEQGDARVQLVKLDVDGFECDILRGASTLLQVSKPIFVMELAPYVLVERGTSLDELLSFFIPNGYRFYDERRERPLPSTAAGLQKLIADGESINVIARAN
jgi:FkbM family methyltransferase